MFRPLGPADFHGFPLGPVRAADVRDGLSRTAAISEMLVATGELERLRVDWNTPDEYPESDQFSTFAAVCESIPNNAAQYGWLGSPIDHGLPWTHGAVGK